MLLVVDKLSEILDQGGAVDTIYLDIAKAFDSVPHERLLLKLQCYGVNGCVLQEALLLQRDRATLLL